MIGTSTQSGSASQSGSGSNSGTASQSGTSSVRGTSTQTGSSSQSGSGSNSGTATQSGSASASSSPSQSQSKSIGARRQLRHLLTVDDAEARALPADELDAADAARSLLPVGGSDEAGWEITVSCLLVRNSPPAWPQAPVVPTVQLAGIGSAYVPANVALDVSLYVANLSTSSGSLLGGTVVNFTGTGFGPWYTVGATFNYFDPWGDAYWADCPIFATADDGSWAACETQLPNDHCLDAACNPLDAIVGAFVVNVNNVTAPCVNSSSGASVCGYVFDPDATPNATSYSVSGTTLTLVATHLSAADPVTSIFVGGAPCTGIVQSSPTSIDCTLPAGLVPGGLPSAISGYTSQGTIASTLSYTFPLEVTSLSDPAGSAAGGALVTLSGAGFDAKNLSNNVVWIGSSSAPAVSTAAYVLSAA